VAALRTFHSADTIIASYDGQFVANLPKFDV